MTQLVRANNAMKKQKANKPSGIESRQRRLGRVDVLVAAVHRLVVVLQFNAQNVVLQNLEHVRARRLQLDLRQPRHGLHNWREGAGARREAALRQGDVKDPRGVIVETLPERGQVSSAPGETNAAEGQSRVARVCRQKTATPSSTRWWCLVVVVVAAATAVVEVESSSGRDAALRADFPASASSRSFSVVSVFLLGGGANGGGGGHGRGGGGGGHGRGGGGGGGGGDGDGGGGAALLISATITLQRFSGERLRS